MWLACKENVKIILKIAQRRCINISISANRTMNESMLVLWRTTTSEIGKSSDVRCAVSLLNPAN